MPAASTAALQYAPSSQTTAEVREYRCMFTHDLRRKAKRWKDGFLSYHTFNDRIVVYDESRNRIGDTYWPRDAAFNEGEELQLQQGVLVTVEEALGSKEQDVSGVVASRAPSRTTGPTVSQSRSLVPPGATWNTLHPDRGNTGAQSLFVAQKPKTLKEVLNTPMGSLGRARLPEFSPYEERHGKSPNMMSGFQPLLVCNVPGGSGPVQTPPRKRRKVDQTIRVPEQRTPEQQAIKRRLPEHGESAQGSYARTTDAQKRPVGATKSKLARLKPREPVSRASNPIIIDSDEEMIEVSPAGKATSYDQHFGPSTKTSEDSRAAVKSSKPKVRADPKTVSDHGKAKQALVRHRDADVANTEGDSKAMRPPPRPGALQERPINTLRLAASKPRRKLLYRNDLSEPRRGEDTVSATTSDPVPKAPKQATAAHRSTPAARRIASSLHQALPLDAAKADQHGDADANDGTTNPKSPVLAPVHAQRPEPSEPGSLTDDDQLHVLMLFDDEPLDQATAKALPEQPRQEAPQLVPDDEHEADQDVDTEAVQKPQQCQNRAEAAPKASLEAPPGPEDAARPPASPTPAVQQPARSSTASLPAPTAALAPSLAPAPAPAPASAAAPGPALAMSSKSPGRGPLSRVQTDTALRAASGLVRRRPVRPLQKTHSDTTGSRGGGGSGPGQHQHQHQAQQQRPPPPEPSVACAPPDPPAPAAAAAVVPAIPEPDRDADADKGPWSRDAFDLFGWRPGNAKKGLISTVEIRRPVARMMTARDRL